MVDWEKGEECERVKWQTKIYSLINKIERGNRQEYNKYMFIDILRKYLLEEEK